MIYARYMIGVYLMNIGFRIMPRSPATDLLRDVLDDYREQVMDTIIAKSKEGK